jgi:hypothetical protein
MSPVNSQLPRLESLKLQAAHRYISRRLITVYPPSLARKLYQTGPNQTPTNSTQRYDLAQD